MERWGDDDMRNAEREVRNAEWKGGRRFRILAALWRLNVAEELQYRANIVASVLGTVFGIGTALLTLAVFFRHTARLGGWDYWEVVVLLGVFNALTGLIEAMLRPGIGELASEVRSGHLDLVLSRPVDAQAFVSLRRLDLWRLTDVALGLGLAAYALHRVGHVPSALELVAFAVAFASAAVVVYAIWVVLMSLAFWLVAVENLSVLFDALYEGARYPVSAYPGALRFLFVYLVPIAWTTTIPASAVTGRLGPGIGLAAAAVAVAAFALARLLWQLALKRYTGASG
jgi:ABC-2 type transport system permease protein